jgi:hypothetical protein
MFKVKLGTKSESVLIHMLVRRVLDLRWDVVECNKILQAYSENWKLLKTHDLKKHWYFSKTKNFHYLEKYQCDLTLLKNLSIFNLTGIPIIDLNSHENLDKTIEIYKLRWNTIVDVSFASKVMSRELVSVKNFNKVFKNPVYDDSLLTRAWGQIIVAEIHNS